MIEKSNQMSDYQQSKNKVLKIKFPVEINMKFSHKIDEDKVLNKRNHVYAHS